MKEYIKPFVEVIELPKDDIIVTSGGRPQGTGSHEETNPGSIGPFGASKLGANGLNFD